MDGITQQRGSTDIRSVLALIGILISVYVGGFLAFLYIKFMHGRKHPDNFKMDMLRNLLAVSIVTALMYLASSLGVHLADAQYPPEIFPLAKIFFVECFLALTWSSLVHYKWKESSPKRMLVLWVGLAVIFICWESFLGALLLGLNFHWLLDLGFYQHMVNQTINTSVDAFYGAIEIIKNPKQYAINLFIDCYGIQFLMIKEFPKWSVILLGGLMLLSPKFIYQRVMTEEQNES